MKRIITASNRRPVQAAETEKEDTRVADMISLLKDDFDYALEGFEKLERIGDIESALGIMQELSDNINIAIQQSAEQITQ